MEENQTNNNQTQAANASLAQANATAPVNPVVPNVNVSDGDSDALALSNPSTQVEEIVTPPVEAHEANILNTNTPIPNLPSSGSLNSSVLNQVIQPQAAQPQATPANVGQNDLNSASQTNDNTFEIPAANLDIPLQEPQSPKSSIDMPIQASTEVLDTIQQNPETINLDVASSISNDSALMPQSIEQDSAIEQSSQLVQPMPVNSLEQQAPIETSSPLDEPVANLDLNNVLADSAMAGEGNNLSNSITNNDTTQIQPQAPMQNMPELKMMSNPFPATSELPPLNQDFSNQVTQPMQNTILQDMPISNTSPANTNTAQAPIEKSKKSSLITSILSILTVLGIVILVAYIVILLVPDLKNSVCDQFSGNTSLENVFSCSLN